MSISSDRVLITNYDQIVEYFKNFPEHIHSNVSNTESRPISPANDYEPHENRSTK
mgnify:CR=1 FL=1